jgi:hypothetical protein
MHCLQVIRLVKPDSFYKQKLMYDSYINFNRIFLTEVHKEISGGPVATNHPLARQEDKYLKTRASRVMFSDA